MSRSKRPRKTFVSSLRTAKVQQAELYQTSVRPLNSVAKFERTDYLSPREGEVRFEPNAAYWKERHTEFEDTARHWMQDFALRPVTDMKHQASKVVQAINHGYPRPEIQRTKRAYLNAFEDVNLCFQCGSAIKVTKSFLNRETRKVQKHRPKVHRYERSNYNIPHFERKEFGGLTYGIVLSHFEWYWGDDGKAHFYYVDGSNRHIVAKSHTVKITTKAKTYWERKRADKNGEITRTRKSHSFVEILSDGSERPVVPNTQYKVWGPKCTCPFRRRDFVKFTAADRM